MTNASTPTYPDLAGKVALITGSSRGIGAAIARFFAARGARVVVHGRDTAAMEAVVADIERAGGSAIPIAADITVFAEIEAMRRQAEEAFGPLDVVVANAGGSLTRPDEPIEETTEEAWRSSLDTNLTGTFFTLKSVLPGMKTRGRGAIVTLSSAAARRPSDRSPAPYVAAKAGIELLTKSAAIQAGPFGVRVNCIAPETILTERNEAQIPEEVQAQLAKSHPIRRLGTPEDVALAALYLVSDDAAWVTGIVLDVAGGAVLV